MKTKGIKGLFIGGVVIAVAVVAAVYVIPLVRHRSQNVSLGRQWMGLLKKHPIFSAKLPAYPIDVDFHYAPQLRTISKNCVIRTLWRRSQVRDQKPSA